MEANHLETSLPHGVEELDVPQDPSLPRGHGTGGQFPVRGCVDALTDSQRSVRAGYPVALVSMPLGFASRPSIQLGLLAAIGRSHGFPITTVHATVDFSHQIGHDAYNQLSASRHDHLGDWLFSVAAFGDDAPDREGQFLDALGDRFDKISARIRKPREWLRSVRDVEVPRFLDALAQLDWGVFRVVAFSCTFQQNAASFALARRIKQRWPEVRTLFGGANFDEPMGPEWVRSVPAIDLAVMGEADRAFPELLVALAEGQNPTAVPGVLARVAGNVARGPATQPIEDLDDLPVPVYDEYFERAAAVGAVTASSPPVALPFESARGCWWGEKMQCTFCGLNGTTMRYRAKRPVRVQEELAELARTYGSFSLMATDNILDPSYVEEVLGRLAAAGTGYSLFYEIKANLTRWQIARLQSGGVVALQPGIESLDSDVLRLMKKGTRAIHNVNLLRWCQYYGVETHWNLLWGFPGERAESYVQQAALMRWLHHLRPPKGVGRINLDRFSPHFERGDPVRDQRRPAIGYRYSYPAGVDLERAAYHFEGELEGSVRDDAAAPVVAAARAWIRRVTQDPPPRLVFRWAPGIVQIEDTRGSIAHGSFTMGDPVAAIYAECSDEPRTLGQLVEHTGASETEVRAALDELRRRGLSMRDGNLYLSLALPPVRLPDGIERATEHRTQW